MKTSQLVGAIILANAIVFGGFAGIIHLDNHYRVERKAADQCWIKDGTYKGGKCEMPQKSPIQLRAEEACADDNYYVLEGDPVIYCIDSKHGVYKVNP